MSTIAAQQKIVVVIPSLSPLEWICTCKDFPCVVDFVEDNISCDDCLACPMIVAVDIGRCCQTAGAVCPSHWV